MRKLKAKMQSWQRSLKGKYLRPGYEPNLPQHINIEAASICNLRCSCCPHGASPGSMRSSGIMSVDVFHKVLSNLDVPFKLAYLHLHGEPFLNPNLPNFVNELTSRKVAVNLYSNCTDADNEKWDAILDAKRVAVNFSADLLGQDYYDSIRVGTHYGETMNKLDSINEVFARHKMFFNMTIVMDNGLVDHIDDVVRCCEMLYRRYSQLNGILLGSKFPWPRLPLTGDLAGHLGPGHHRCTHAFEGISVLWNGDATMCSFDYTGECVVGSLLDNTYREVLNNSAARKFRMLHWRHRDTELPLCRDCLLDRFTPVSVTLHRSGFLNKDYHEKTRIIKSFFQL